MNLVEAFVSGKLDVNKLSPEQYAEILGGMSSKLAQLAAAKPAAEGKAEILSGEYLDIDEESFKNLDSMMRSIKFEFDHCIFDHAREFENIPSVRGWIRQGFERCSLYNLRGSSYYIWWGHKGCTVFQDPASEPFQLNLR